MRNMRKYFVNISVGVASVFLLASGSLSFPVQAQEVAKPAGLVAWWKAEGNANDSVGGHHGTLYNGATATALGKVGQAFSFDGVDDRISVPDDDAFKLTHSISIEGWIAPTAYAGPLILFRGDNRSGLDPYALQIYPDGRIGFYVTSETALEEVVSSTSVPLNTFSHVAGTLDDATGEMRVYIDGVLRGSTTTAVRALGDLDLASLFSGTGKYSLKLNPDGSFSFRPRNKRPAIYFFTYTVSDGTTTSEP
jgi:hypothetical protein